MGAPATVVAQAGIAAYIIKSINDRFRKAAREVTDTDKTQDAIEAMSNALKVIPDLERRIAQIEKNLDGLRESNLAQLRSAITNIFYKYINVEYLPYYEHENLRYLSEEYDKRGGNSYVSQIVPMLLSKPVCSEEIVKEGKHHEDQLESQDQQSSVDWTGIGGYRGSYSDVFRVDSTGHDYMGSRVGRSGEGNQ